MNAGLISSRLFHLGVSLSCIDFRGARFPCLFNVTHFLLIPSRLMHRKHDNRNIAFIVEESFLHKCSICLHCIFHRSNDGSLFTQQQVSPCCRLVLCIRRGIVARCHFTLKLPSPVGYKHFATGSFASGAPSQFFTFCVSFNCLSFQASIRIFKALTSARLVLLDSIVTQRSCLLAKVSSSQSIALKATSVLPIRPLRDSILALQARIVT